MGDFLRRLRNGFVIGLGFILALATVPLGYAASSIAICGTSNCIFPADFADLNLMITAVNNELASYVTFGNPGETGQMALSSSAAFAANGSTATAMSSVGPTGSHTTVQKWLIVYDQAGTIFYVPMF